VSKQKTNPSHWHTHLYSWAIGVAACVGLGVILDYVIAPHIIQEPNIDPHIKEIVIRLCRQANATCSNSVESLPSVFKIPLKSSVGIDYVNLRHILASKNWKEADQETYKLMLETVGQVDKESKSISASDIKHYPCDDLVTIDQLWQTSSDGKFGFSKQYEIWKKIGGIQTVNWKTVEAFGEEVGWYSTEGKGFWKSYDQLNFSANAEYGHLPAMFYSINCFGWGCMKGDVPDETSSVFSFPERFLYCTKPRNESVK